jgi:hypothetical protein
MTPTQHEFAGLIAAPKVRPTFVYYENFALVGDSTTRRLRKAILTCNLCQAGQGGGYTSSAMGETCQSRATLTGESARYPASTVKLLVYQAITAY